ncbi:hypothetical protein OH76DRAFT_835269 [Lentinus brumalis]|uniref:F-box domain-containing protein n=1 Tax=Lentinus brumalis TaxID=2498619 RepID=A0A371D219_9APHY|nr:hypothetical protein OH76DRAFT_835269 [Polyporus brumalis]
MMQILELQLYKVSDLLKATECSIRTAINARAPIHRILPPELILAIFALVPARAYSPEDIFEAACGPYSLLATAELVPVTSVCKFWRSLAFGASTLWSSLSYGLYKSQSHPPYLPPLHISCLPPDCIGHGPLYVHAQPQGFNSEVHPYTTSGFLLKHGHQVEELHIRVKPHRTSASIAHRLAQFASVTIPATTLRRLVVRGICDRRRWQDMALFGDVPLNLSSLAMLDARFLPSNAAGSSLTRLLLCEYSSWAEKEPAIPLRNLLPFLAQNPGLEQVYLRGIAECEDIQSLPVVTMSRVRKLVVTPALGASQLLSRLRLSETCLLRLRGDIRSREQNEALSTAISSLGWSGAKAHLMWDGDRKKGAGGQVSLQVINRSAGGLRLDLYSQHGTDADVAQVIRTYLSFPPFVTAQELWLSGPLMRYFLEQGDGPPGAISPLSALSTLHLLNSAGLEYETADILWPDSTSQIAMDNLPNLTCLHCGPLCKKYLKGLVAVLGARAHANHPLARLFVSIPPGSDDSSLSDSEVNLTMQELVPEVEVGYALYDRVGHSWQSVVPRECTAEEEVHVQRWTKGEEVYDEEVHVQWPAWTEVVPECRPVASDPVVRPSDSAVSDDIFWFSTE